MWTLEHPEFLLALIPLSVLVWYRHFFHRRRGFVSFAFSQWGGDQYRSPLVWQAMVHRASVVIFWTGFACLVLALSGPVKVSRERVFINDGIQLMVVLDSSPSMAAQDHGAMSRFDQARKTITEFIAGRSNDSIGLVAFASDASLRSPLTLDYATVQDRLAAMSISQEGTGTAVGVGLSLAALHLKETGIGRKVIVLLTDGENNAGDISPELATTMLVELGIKVYSIGMGAPGDVPLEYRDAANGKIFRGVYRSGFNETILKDLAAKTGGNYFSASQSVALESIFKAIDRSEKTEPRLRIDIVTTSLVDLFVMIGLLCIVLDVLVRRVVIKELA